MTISKFTQLQNAIELLESFGYTMKEDEIDTKVELDHMVEWLTQKFETAGLDEYLNLGGVYLGEGDFFVDISYKGNGKTILKLVKEVGNWDGRPDWWKLVNKRGRNLGEGTTYSISNLVVREAQDWVDTNIG